MTEIEKTVIDLYVEGKSLKDIRIATDYSDVEIYRVLKKHSINLREGYKISLAQQKKVIQLYSDGTESIESIMGKTNIRSKQTIYAILRRNGIIKRNNKK